VRNAQARKVLTRECIECTTLLGTGIALLEYDPGKGCVFDDGTCVIESVNDQPVTAELDGTSHTLEPRSWIYRWKSAGSP